jgi:hypothetical protein
VGRSPVAPRPAFAIWLALVLSASAACGYRPLYAASPAGTERMHVALVRALVPDAAASDEVVAGVRDALSRASLLQAGEGFPRIEVEVLRQDEESRGIADVAGQPVSRASGVGLVARAWVVRSAGAAPEDDTGDMRSEETVAVDETAGGVHDPRASAFQTEDALRAAARRLGRKLGDRIMGLPAASEER